MKVDRVALAVACAFTLVAGAALAMRPGYSPDEEITWFLVRGIRETWRPRLPSGLDYWRGPIYSYAAWLAGAIGGFSFPAYRMVSVVLSLGAVVSTFAIARRISMATAATATAIVAIMPAVVANAAYARFYAVLIAATAAALAALITRRSLGVFVAIAVAARLSHELGVAIVVFPLAAWLCGYELHPSFHKVRNVALGIGTLVVLHFVLVSLQRAGISGEAASAGGAWLGMPIPRLGMWPVVQIARWHDWLILSTIALGACAWLRSRVRKADLIFIAAIAAAAVVFSVAGILVVATFWVLSDPVRKTPHLGIALAFAACSWLMWLAIIGLRSDMLMTGAAAVDLLTTSIRANMDGMEFLARELPLTSLFIALAAVASIISSDSEAGRIVRTVTNIFFVYALAFGIFGTDPRTRFIAVTAPLIAILAGAAVNAAGASRPWRWPRAALALVIAVVVITEQRAFVAAMTERPTTAIGSPWSAWFPTVGLEHPFDAAMPRPQANEIVITNDELAAVLTLGHSDYWLAPDDYAARFYGRSISPTRFEGIYAGSRVIVAEAELQSVLATNRLPAMIVWFRSGKFGAASPSYADHSLWPPGSTFQDSSDWSMVRIPAR